MEGSGETWKLAAWAGGVIVTLAASIKIAVSKIVPLNKADRELITSLQRDMIEVTYTLRTAVERLERISGDNRQLGERISKIEGRLNGG